MLKLFRVGVSGTGLVAHPTNAFPKQIEHLNYNVLSLKNVSMYRYIVVHVDKHLQKLYIPLRMLAGGIKDAAVC